MTHGTGSSDGRPRNVGPEHTSTVGRGKAVVLDGEPENPFWSDDLVSVAYGDALDHYGQWEAPTVIVSDGGYGVLGFEGDTSDHLELPQWYEPHVEQWAKHALPSTIPGSDPTPEPNTALKCSKNARNRSFQTITAHCTTASTTRHPSDRSTPST